MVDCCCLCDVFVVKNIGTSCSLSFVPFFEFLFVFKFRTDGQPVVTFLFNVARLNSTNLPVLLLIAYAMMFAAFCFLPLCYVINVDNAVCYIWFFSGWLIVVFFVTRCISFLICCSVF